MPLNWETLLCVGDSITLGARSYLGYPEQCAHHLGVATGRHWNVVNHAVNGYRAIDLARSIDLHHAAIASQNPGLCTLMVGTNDLKAPTSGTDFATAYSLLVLKLRLLMRNGNILLLEIPPLQEGVMLPYRLNMNSVRDDLNRTIRTIGSANGLNVERFNVSPADLFDGVHLNDEGAARWGEQLAGMILKMRQE